MPVKTYATTYNQAVSIWNKKTGTKGFRRPKKGSDGYNEVKAIQAQITSGKIPSLVAKKEPKAPKEAKALSGPSGSAVITGAAIKAKGAVQSESLRDNDENPPGGRLPPQLVAMVSQRDEAPKPSETSLQVVAEATGQPVAPKPISVDALRDFDMTRKAHLKYMHRKFMALGLPALD